MSIAAAQHPAPRLLVVDDEAVITIALQTFFGAQRFAVDAAADLEEALDHLEQRRYEVIIADLRLTGTSGEEGLEVIRVAREKNPGAVILLLTAFHSPAVECHALEAGANRILQKPQPLLEIAAIVRSLLEAETGGNPGFRRDDAETLSDRW